MKQNDLPQANPSSPHLRNVPPGVLTTPSSSSCLIDVFDWLFLRTGVSSPARELVSTAPLSLVWVWRAVGDDPRSEVDGIDTSTPDFAAPVSLDPLFPTRLIRGVFFPDDCLSLRTGVGGGWKDFG